jgi:hypothetical protein
MEEKGFSQIRRKDFLHSRVVWRRNCLDVQRLLRELLELGLCHDSKLLKLQNARHLRAREREKRIFFHPRTSAIYNVQMKTAGKFFELLIFALLTPRALCRHSASLFEVSVSSLALFERKRRLDRTNLHYRISICSTC